MILLGKTSKNRMAEQAPKAPSSNEQKFLLVLLGQPSCGDRLVLGAGSGRNVRRAGQHHTQIELIQKYSIQPGSSTFGSAGSCIIQLLGGGKDSAGVAMATDDAQGNKQEPFESTFPFSVCGFLLCSWTRCCPSLSCPLHVAALNNRALV